MKLRISRNSIRLRVSPSDVERLMRDGIVEESILLGGAVPFSFRLTVEESVEAVATARVRDGIEIRLPAQTAKDWANSDCVGIDVVEEHVGGFVTKILVEKDFACEHPRSWESGADVFQRPEMACS